MANVNLGKKCPYANDCPVYKGEIEAVGIPLYIYRNVFCNRGYKGWTNCERYTEFRLQA